MEVLNELIVSFLIYVLVPGTMIALIVGSLGIALGYRASPSSIAGWLAGVVLFIIYLLYTPNSLVASSEPLYQELGLAIGFLIIGLVVGFILSTAIANLTDISMQVVSLLILLLNFTGLAGLHVFYVVRVYNDVFISAMAGLLFGLLLYFIFFETGD